MKTKQMHQSSSTHFVTQFPHVSGMFIAHHLELFHPDPASSQST
jgi:hypothetical protein